MKVVRVQEGNRRQLFITLPKQVADRAGIRKGMDLAIIEDKECIRIVKAEKLKEALLIMGGEHG